MRHLVSFILAVGLAWGFLTISPAAAQESIYGSPSADYYINRTRGQDRLNYGVRQQVQSDLNRGRPAGGVSIRPSFLQGGGAVGGQTAPAEKPFANASHRPTVSPYLNLMRDDLTDEFVPNYHTLVRPQLDQIQFQQTQQRRNEVMYRQLQQVQAQAAFNPQGSETMTPTGHMTTFQYYQPYYPGLARGRR